MGKKIIVVSVMFVILFAGFAGNVFANQKVLFSFENNTKEEVRFSIVWLNVGEEYHKFGFGSKVFFIQNRLLGVRERYSTDRAGFNFFGPENSDQANFLVIWSTGKDTRFTLLPSENGVTLYASGKVEKARVV